MTDWGGRIASAARRVVGREAGHLKQLRTATMLDAICPEGVDLPAFTFHERRLAEAAYLVRVAELNRSRRDRRREPDALVQVATAFADLAERSPRGSAYRMEFIAQSAAMWSLAGYQANASVIARRLLEEIDADPPSVSRELARLVAALLARDLRAAGELARRAEERVPELGDVLLSAQPGDGAVVLEDATLIAAYGLSGRATRAAVDYWRRGLTSRRDESLDLMGRASSLLLEAGIVDGWLLVDNGRLVLEDAFGASLWRLLPGRAPIWNFRWGRYVQRLAGEEGMVEVWPSQQRAIEDHLLARGRRVLAAEMPTSAGKTRMSEFALLADLSDSVGDRLAVFVVPSRALASEVEERLARALGPIGIRVSALFGGFDSADFEFELLGNTDVLVATAEKLDLLLRQDTGIVERLSLVIVDEGHLLAEGERGLRLELLLTRLRRRVPSVRVLLMSAVFPNLEEVAQWLADGEQPDLSRTSWTPSRPAVGIFRWTGREHDGQTGTVRYVDHEDQYFVPYVLRRRLLRKNHYPRTKAETAAELALHYQHLGPVIVAAATKPSVRGVAKAIDGALRRHDRDGDPIALIDSEHADAIARLENLVREVAGDDHELVGFVKQGFAYHTADVPEQLRLAFERAYRDGALRILVATSTLSQGVNLPARTVIVSHPRRGQSAWISVREFRNLAGRAGRALVETEGHVILVADGEYEAAQLKQRYVDQSPEPVLSALLLLFHDIARQRFPGQGLDALQADSELPEEESEIIQARLLALDNQLLAMAAEELLEDLDPLSLERLIGRTLCGTQGRIYEVPLPPLGRYLARRAHALAERVPEPALRRCFYRTGLSVAGCESLLAGIDALLAADPEKITDPDRFEDLRTSLLEVAVHSPEVIGSCEELAIDPADLPGSPRIGLRVSDWRCFTIGTHLR